MPSDFVWLPVYAAARGEEIYVFSVLIISCDLDLCSRPKRNSRASLAAQIEMNGIPSYYMYSTVYAAARGEDVSTVIFVYFRYLVTLTFSQGQTTMLQIV